MWALAWGLLRRFSTPLLLASLLALMALGGWAALQKVKAGRTISDLEKSIGEVRRERDKAKLDLSEAQRIGAEQLATKQAENEKLSANWQTAFNKAEEERLNEATRLKATVVAVSADRDRLRKLTSAATAGYPPIAGGSACDSPSVRRAYETAQTLGELLGASDGVSQAVGTEAEELASQVRGLQVALSTLNARVASGEIRIRP